MILILTFISLQKIAAPLISFHAIPFSGHYAFFHSLFAEPSFYDAHAASFDIFTSADSFAAALFSATRRRQRRFLDAAA
jgi:hypothetical protein